MVTKHFKTGKEIQAPLQWHPRKGTYGAGKAKFNPTAMVATSYDWWVFVKKIGGKLIFNEYTYSKATSGHQSKVRRTLDALGIKPNMAIEAKSGLQSCDVFVSAILRHCELAANATIAEKYGTALQWRKKIIKNNLAMVERIQKFSQQSSVKREYRAISKRQAKVYFADALKIAENARAKKLERNAAKRERIKLEKLAANASDSAAMPKSENAAGFQVIQGGIKS